MTLSAGTPTTATGLGSGTDCNDWQFIPLTTDKGVYIYFASGTGIVGRVVTSSGTSISTVGSPTTITTESTISGTYRPVKMSSSGFVLVYGEAGGSIGRIRGVACTVSGTTISAGTPANIVSATGTINSLDDVFGARCGDDKCVVVYSDLNGTPAGAGTAVAFTVSGTTVNSPGSAHVFQSGFAVNRVGADEFYGSGTHVLVMYTSFPSSNIVYAHCLSVSGTTVSSGSAQAVTGTATHLWPRPVGLDSTTAFLVYELASGAQAGKARSVTRSGTTLSLGSTTANWATDTSANIPYDIARVADDLAVLIFSESNNNLERAIEIKLTSGEADPQTALTLEDPAEVQNMGVAVVNTSTVMAIYSTDQVAILSSSLAAFSGYDLIQSSGGLAKYALGVSADGNNVFIALEDNASGNQIVFKATRPSSPTVSAIYEPGGGSAANVIPTGDPDKMIFFGNFGTDVGVILHTISADTEGDISPSSIGTDKIQPVAIDPSDVNHLVAINQADQDALETEDGSTWSTLNAALGQTPVAMGIIWLGALFPLGGFIGGNDGTDENLTYTPNEFANLREDTSAALKAVGAITGIDLVVS